MPLITVEGRADHHLPAERGTVRVRVRSTADDPLVPRARATRAFDTLASLARSEVAAGSATWWGADGVVTWSAKEWHKPSAHVEGTYVERHHAAAGITVKFSDFSRLHTFVSTAAEVPDATVHQVEWTLTEAARDRAVRTARTAATQDARSRADAYARAAGLSDVSLVHLHEAGLRPGIGHGGDTSGVGARNGVASHGATGDLALHPDQITVTAVVTADFEAR